MAKLSEGELLKYYVKKTSEGYYDLYAVAGNKYMGRLGNGSTGEVLKGNIDTGIYSVGEFAEGNPDEGKITNAFCTAKVKMPGTNGKFALEFLRFTGNVQSNKTVTTEIGELVAFLGEKAQWFLGNATVQGPKLGSIYRNDQPLIGAWPVPVAFSDEIKVELKNNKEVEGDIDFYIQDGTYAGTLSFDKSGKCTGVKKDNFENDTKMKFIKAFFKQSRNSKVAEWKNATNIHEICIAVKKDRFFRRKLAKYLEPHSSDVNDEGKEILKRELHIDKIPPAYETHAGCLLYIYFVNTGKISIASDLSNDVETSNVAEKVLEFTKQAKGWKTKDGDYFLSAHSGNEASRADVVVLCKMINDKLVKLYNKDGKPTSGIGTIFDGEKDLGKVTFNNSGEITESSIKEPTDSNGLGRFYDSVKEYDGELKFYKSIKEYDGDLSYLALEIDVRKVIEKAGLNTDSGEYGDFARAIENHKRLKPEIDAVYEEAIKMKVAKNEGMVYNAQELLDRISIDEGYKNKIKGEIEKLKTEEEKVDAIRKLLPSIEDYKRLKPEIDALYSKARDKGLINKDVQNVTSAQELLSSISLDEEYKSKINDKIRKLKTEEEKVDLISRLLLRLENKEDKEARKRYKNRSILSKPFHKKERDAGIVNRNIRSSFKNAAKYIMKCVSKPDALKCSDLLNNFRLLSKDKQLYRWPRRVESYMNENKLSKCADAIKGTGDIGIAKIKVALGILFAHMMSLGGPNNVICACNALKDGGIKSKEQNGVIADATKIRKAIKAKCGSAVKADVLEIQIKKLCVDDCKFLTLQNFEEMISNQKDSDDKQYMIPWNPEN